MAAPISSTERNHGCRAPWAASASLPASTAASGANSIPGVLIDGKELRSLMVRHGVGVQPEQTIIVRKLDEDFFE